MTRMLKALFLLLLSLLTPGVPAQERQGDYLLGAGDAIRILVFQNPDLTLETRVTEERLHHLSADRHRASRRPDHRRRGARRIAKGLKDGGFVQKPQVNIVLMQIRGNQVSVLGQVNRPGRFPLETFNTRVSDMLAIAGGIAATGSDTVIVTGIRDGKPFRKEIDIAGHLYRRQAERRHRRRRRRRHLRPPRAGLLHLRRSPAPRLLPHRARHDRAAGPGPGRRPDRARHRKPAAPASPQGRRQRSQNSPPN